MGGSKTRKTDGGFPDDLVMQLLIRLPGKQVGRCKCVSKSWKSMIESRYFKDDYGVRHRGLILYRDDRLTKNDGSRLLQIYYSTTCGKQEEFSQLCTLIINHVFNSGNYSSLTQIVNGLLCVDYKHSEWLSIYNVCTGEMMRIPDLPRNAEEERPKFHLGYVPSSGRYKLLRLTSICAHVMTLRPSTSSSTWKLIKLGIRGGGYMLMQLTRKREEVSNYGKEVKISPNDGFACWLLFGNILALFDFTKERFQMINLGMFVVNLWDGYEGFVRAEFMEHRQRLSLTLWGISKPIQIGLQPPTRLRLQCFVMDDEDGKRWKEHSIEFPQQLDLDKAAFVSANGNLSSTSSSELVLTINTAENENDVYCYDSTSEMETQFRVGKPPGYPNVTEADLRARPDFYRKHYPSGLSCLYDANKLYLPLDDILSA